jgi:glycosyltransferase involved in cell wall biosynthesis
MSCGRGRLGRMSRKWSLAVPLSPPEQGETVSRRGAGPSRRDDTPDLRVAVLIPALNEEATLAGVIEGLRGVGLDRVIVVDNGSTDDTVGVATAAGAEVVYEPRRGYGAACLAGIEHLAKTGPPEVLVFMDGDQSDDPTAVDAVVEPIRAGRADLVVGVRGPFRSGASSAVPLHARLGNALVLGGARLLHGSRFQDLGPFRAIRFPVLQSLKMDDRTWGWTLQMQLRAHRLGVTIAEVAVPHRERAGGRSKISGTVSGSFRAGTKMLFTLFRERFHGMRERESP